MSIEKTEAFSREAILARNKMDKTLFISRIGFLWHVHFKNECVGPIFSDRSAALNAATNLVLLYSIGDISRIKIEKDNGNYEIIWRFGVDQYPPLLISKLN